MKLDINNKVYFNGQECGAMYLNGERIWGQTIPTPPEPPVEEPGDFKSLLMYVGPSYSTYSDNFLNGLKNNLEDMRIIIMSDVFGVANWIYDEVNPAEAYKEKYGFNAITHLRAGIAYNGHDNTTSIIDSFNTKIGYSGYDIDTEYITKAITLANRIVAINPKAKIWLSYPYIAYLCISDAFDDMFKHVYDTFKSQLSSIWEKNIEGFYYGTEDIDTWACYFKHDADNNYYDCTPVAEQWRLREHMNTDPTTTNKKKFMWIPYFGYTNTSQQIENAKRIAKITNNLDLFDYIILPTSAPFDSADVARNNYDIIEYSCKAGKIKTYDDENQPGAATKISSTLIGYEMEWANDSNNTISGFAGRGLKNNYPCCYYIGAPFDDAPWSTTTENNMITLLSDWYNS